MPDPADIANDTFEVCLEDARRRQLGKSGAESHPEFDGEHCVDCDESIPVVRLQLGRVRCVGCQSILEKNAALRQHNIRG